MKLMSHRQILTFYIKVVFLVALMTISGISQAMAHSVFLKDGTILQGKIIHEGRASVTFKTDEGKRKIIPQNKILRILYINNTFGRVYIRLRDRSDMKVFIVDEDRISYTTRKVLSSPKETTIQRADILFITDLCPSILTGLSGTTEARLKWYAPYTPVQYYNIYIKKKGKRNFTLAGKSFSTSTVLQNLKSNSRYTFKVTAVDSSGEESLPTEELALDTKNIHPTKPKILSVKEKNKESKGMTLHFTWEKSIDPDGTVKKYRVYSRDKGKYLLIMETRAVKYTIAADKAKDGIAISSVDDRGDESSKAYLLGKEMGLTVSPGVMLFWGGFSDLPNIGTGGTISYQLTSYFAHGLLLRADLGFYYLFSQDTLAATNRQINSAYFAALALTAGYRFTVNYQFAIAPYLSAGMGYIYINSSSHNPLTLVDSDAAISEAGPVVGAGVKADVHLSEGLKMTADLSVGYLPGSSYIYASFEIGFQFRFNTIR
jgi:hypothetical protein